VKPQPTPPYRLMTPSTPPDPEPVSRRRFLQQSAQAGALGLAVAHGLRPLSAYAATPAVGAAAAPVILHNGIRLPQVWPPVHMDPASPEPMPVPYLTQRPDVVPIDTGRQLFVDDFLIEDSYLQRRFHQPTSHPANPVLRPQTAHELDSTGLEGDERAVCYLGHGGVFYDPADRLIKMYYTAGWRGGLALATSRDGIHWERPELGLAGGNLILGPGDDHAGGDNAIWLDLETANPQERYKMITTRGRAAGSRAFRHTLHTSPDGLHWSAGRETGPASDYCTFHFDPFRRVWVYSIKQNGPRGRCRHYAEHADFLKGADWKDSVYWTNADRLDPADPVVDDAPQLYSLNAVAYESLQLGMFYIHRGPTNRACEAGKFPKITDLSIGFSRDGFHWDRPDRTPFLAASRNDGAWDRAYLHSTAGVCLVMGDHLLFPYTGYSGVAPDGTRGMYTGASIGMAVLRRDGFASLDAAAETATVTTRPVTFSGSHLFVNVRCPLGRLRVEVLDRAGQPIRGLTAAECLAVSVDSTCQRITWRDAGALGGVAGKPVRLRFHLQEGSLYAFWVSASTTGASGGYLAAGSPAHPTRRDA